MGACYSSAASYGAWLCGQGSKNLDDIRYHVDGEGSDQFLSDDELLGLDDEDYAQPAARIRREKLLSWHGSRGGRSTVDDHGQIGAQAEIVASPYGNRQLIVHSNHFEPSQLSDGLDSTTGSSSGGTNSPGFSHAAPSAGRGVGVVTGASAELAASSAANVMAATQEALSALYRSDASAPAIAGAPTRGQGTGPEPVAVASFGAATPSFLVGDQNRSAQQPPLSMATSSTRHPVSPVPTQDVSDGRSSSATGPATAASDLTSWIDNPTELRSMDYSQTADSVGPEDFDEFLNSVMARSLTGKYVASHSADLARESPSVAMVSASPDGVLSDLDDDLGLVVGSRGQILPARREPQDSMETYEVEEPGDFVADMTSSERLSQAVTTATCQSPASGRSTPDLTPTQDTMATDAGSPDQIGKS